MEFIETPTFTKKITSLISDESYKDFQRQLLFNPEKGDLIKDGGGIRKIRWNLENKGKSGSIRIIYFYKIQKEIIYMLYAYTKSNKANLSDSEIKILRTLAKELNILFIFVDTADISASTALVSDKYVDNIL